MKVKKYGNTKTNKLNIKQKREHNKIIYLKTIFHCSSCNKNVQHFGEIAKVHFLLN